MIASGAWRTLPADRPCRSCSTSTGWTQPSAYAVLSSLMNRSAQRDFFISYTGADRQWAEWIAYVLEEQGFSVVIQAWDFRPGSNFVVEMQNAAEGATRTILVLSPDYLQSQFAAPEWAAAFAKDPQGIERKLLPVVVRACEPRGMLKSLVHIDLTDRDEADARDTLVEGLGAGRAKPSARPAFPVPTGGQSLTDFPGSEPGRREGQRLTPFIPAMRGRISHLDQRRFGKEAFDAVAAYFETALPILAAADRDTEVDFQRISPLEFYAEVFRSGKSVAYCRVWRGGMLSNDGIGYSEDRNANGRNSYNEMLSISEAQGELRLSALMSGFGFGRLPDGLDVKNLTSDQAAECLWKRLVGRLEH